MQPATADAPTHFAIVRAIPQPGHKYRWGGAEEWKDDQKARPGAPQKMGLPWPGDRAVKVAIVDDPKPYDPTENDGIPTAITPTTLALLERDERLAVRVLVEGEADPGEVVSVKAQLAAAEKKHLDARRDFAQLSEESAAFRVATDEQVKRQAARIAELEQDASQLRAQVTAAQSAAAKKQR